MFGLASELVVDLLVGLLEWPGPGRALGSETCSAIGFGTGMEVDVVVVGSVEQQMQNVTFLFPVAIYEPELLPVFSS